MILIKGVIWVKVTNINGVHSVAFRYLNQKPGNICGWNDILEGEFVLYQHTVWQVIKALGAERFQIKKGEHEKIVFAAKVEKTNSIPFSACY